MNILPKKRWHVRTKDNIARVRKDEAEAREEECKKQEKLELAESEARVNFLRKRSGLPEKHKTEVDLKDQQNNDEKCDEYSSQHVNLFADYKTHIKTTSKELEKEKKEEQEKYEKKIGYLTYLGQDTNEALRLKSWYEVAPKRVAIGSERGDINEKDLKVKHNHDPLTLINALLPSDPKSLTKTAPTKRKRSSTPEVTQDRTDISNNCKRPKKHEKKSKKHKKERKKHKKEKHKKHLKEHKHESEKTKENNLMEKQIQKRLKLEQLRKERLHRETAERARQEALLAPKDSVKSQEAPPKVVQKYNSQFNPELAKQNMN